MGRGSSTMNKLVLQQRFLALRSLIVASGAFTSFLKDGDHRSTWANINHELTSSMTTGHWVLPVHAVNLQNCARNVFSYEEVMCRRAGGLDSSQALQRCSCAIFKTHGCAPRCFTSLTRMRLSRCPICWWIICNPFAQTNSDSHRQQVALTVAVCRVCVSCRKFDDLTLVERREMWSKLAKIGSIDFHVSLANPSTTIDDCLHHLLGHP